MGTINSSWLVTLLILQATMYDNDDDKPCQHTQTEVPPEMVNVAGKG